MTPRLLDLLASISGYFGAAVVLIVAAKWSQSSKLDSIPTASSSSWLGSWWAGLMYLTDVLDVIQHGYKKHKSAPFRVAEFHRWIVILSSHKHVEELRRAPDDKISLDEAINDRLHVEYTMGPEIHHNPYHVPIVRSRLTRNIGVLYPEVKDEIIAAFNDVLDLSGNEWKSISALRSVQEVICRASNRVFVGLPLCRDRDWIDLNIQYSLDVIKGAIIVGLFPDSLKPIAARLFTSINQSKRRGMKLLGPIIRDRLKILNEYGNEWPNKPNDFLSWLMEEADGAELTEKCLTTRVLVLNFSAIHTSSNSFTQALFYLAANPELIQPLREEVEGIVKKEGWSKAAVGKMQKVDSFLKECQRLEGISGSTMIRKALDDYTFSDGTFIPKGTMISVATGCIHHDDTYYSNAHAFEPFRFAELRKVDGNSTKHQFVSTTTEYLSFGHGRHACAGRFFAANLMKTMLAHIVVTYVLKLKDNTACPQALHVGTVSLADPNATVMFKRRV